MWAASYEKEGFCVFSCFFAAKNYLKIYFFKKSFKSSFAQYVAQSSLLGTEKTEQIKFVYNISLKKVAQ